MLLLLASIGVLHKEPVWVGVLASSSGEFYGEGKERVDGIVVYIVWRMLRRGV